jgi:hypothetical protein
MKTKTKGVVGLMKMTGRFPKAMVKKFHAKKGKK